MSAENPASVDLQRQLAMDSDSDWAAQAVCRAIAAHVAHGGRIPWPSIEKPYQEWAKIQETMHCEVIGGKLDR